MTVVIDHILFQFNTDQGAFRFLSLGWVTEKHNFTLEMWLINSFMVMVEY